MAGIPEAHSQHTVPGMERMLIWVEGKPVGGIASVSDTEMAFSPGRCVHFRSAAHFSRWILKQEQGPHVVPHAILVCGPWELKPCAQALLAARKGNEDGQRTKAQQETGFHNSVVGAIICIGDEKKRGLGKLQDWLFSQRQVLPLVGVSCGIKRLLPCLNEMAARMNPGSTHDTSNTAVGSADHGIYQAVVQTRPQQDVSAPARGGAHGAGSRCRTPSPEDIYLALTGCQRPQFFMPFQEIQLPGVELPGALALDIGSERSTLMLSLSSSVCMPWDQRCTCLVDRGAESVV